MGNSYIFLTENKSLNFLIFEMLIMNQEFLFNVRPSINRSLLPFRLFIESAHKKGSGSTKNGRDSGSKRRGLKIFGGQTVFAGSIIIRQVGNKFHAGNNVSYGKDCTIFSLMEGVVKFEPICGRECVSVYPALKIEINAGFASRA